MQKMTTDSDLDSGTGENLEYQEHILVMELMMRKCLICGGKSTSTALSGGGGQMSSRCLHWSNITQLCGSLIIRWTIAWSGMLGLQIYSDTNVYEI